MRAITRWRWADFATYGAILAAALGGGTAFFIVRGTPMAQTALWMWVGGVGAAMVLRVVMRWRQKIIWDRLVVMNRCACLRCTHDLRGLSERGECPECGEKFNLPETREQWLETFQRLEEGRNEETEAEDVIDDPCYGWWGWWR